MPTIAELSIEINADDQATATLRQIEEALRRIGAMSTVINLRAEGNQARTELQFIQEQLNEIGNERTTIPINMTTAEARAQLENLRRELQGLEDAADPSVNLDTTAVRARIAELEAQLAAVTGPDIDVDLDIAGAVAGIAALRALLAGIPDEEVNIRTDTDRLKNITSAASRASTQISALVAAILLIGPALIPIAAVATFALGALSAGLVAAGAGLVLMGAVAISNFGAVSDALTKMDSLQKQYNTAVNDKQRDAAMQKMAALMASLTEPQRAMVAGVMAFKKAWEDFAVKFQPQIFQLAGDSLSFFASLLPKASGLMDGMLKASTGLLASLEKAFTTPAIRSFGTEISRIAGPVFADFVRGIGNIIVGIMGMVSAFFPFATSFSSGFLEMTQRFAAWGQAMGSSPGFKAFIEYARANMPTVMQFIKSLWDALVGLVVALAPLGAVMLKVVVAILQFIAWLAQVNPTIILVTVAALGLVAAFINLLGPILAIISVFTRLAPLLGVALGPLVLWVAGIAAVIAILVIAYAKLEWFRNGVNAVFSAISAAVQAAIPYVVAAFQQILLWGQQAWAWLVQTFGPAIQAVVAFVVAEFNKIVAWAQENAATFQTFWDSIKTMAQAAWTLIVDLVKVAVALVVAVVQGAWGGLVTIVQGIWTVISSVISGALEVIRGLIMVFVGIVTGDWSMLWDGLKAIVSGFWTAISGLVSGGFQIIVGIFQALGGVIASLWSLMWDSIVAVVQPVIDAIAAAWQWLYDFLVGNSLIPDLVNGILTWFTQLGTALLAFMQPIVTVFQVAWEAIKTTITTVLNAIWIAIQFFITQAQNGFTIFWQAVQQVTTAAWTAIKAAVSAGVTAVQTAITNFVNTVKTLWTRFWSTDLVQAVVTGAKAVVTNVTNLGTDILNAVKSIGSQLLSAGQAMMQDFANGIMAGAQFVTSAVNSVVQQATSLLPGSPAETGPLSGQGWSKVRGEHMVADLTAGVLAGVPGLQSAMKSVAGIASGGLTVSAAAAIGPTGGGGVRVEQGAVVVTVGSGADAAMVKQAVGNAGTDLATQINDALRRR